MILITTKIKARTHATVTKTFRNRKQQQKNSNTCSFWPQERSTLLSKKQSTKSSTMGFGKKAAPKKKKGPKGKKARAKAISDRQWGETVDEDAMKQARQRRGKSRLSSTTTAASTTPKKSSLWNKKEQDTPSFQEKILQHKWHVAEGRGGGTMRDAAVEDENDNDDDDQDDVDDDNDEESSQDGSEDEMTTLPVTNLLQSIHKTTKKRRKQEKRRQQQQAALIEEEDDVDSGGEESDQDHSMEEENDDDADDASMSSTASDGNDDKDATAASDGTTMKDDDEDSMVQAASVVDLFGQRFIQSSSEDPAALSARSTTTSPKKLSLEKIPILHTTNVELQLSPAPYHHHQNDTSATEFLRRHGSTTRTTEATSAASETKLQPPTLDDWQTLSQEAFAGNRQVLQRQWRLFNTSNAGTHKKKKNKSLLPSLTTMTANQSYLYPFLARYMDVLVTTQSEVSSSASTLTKVCSTHLGVDFLISSVASNQGSKLAYLPYLS
jgi:hypothetical protein